VKATPIPAKVRAAVHERSGGVCEFCRAYRAEHVHHRLMRSQGGKHELPNLIDLCTLCHHYAHHATDRYDLCLLLRRGSDPATMPVRIEGTAA
jgi:5-methylcytosine-specific restriction endonuclease McrA